MTQFKFGAAGVSSREIDISGYLSQEPSGVPAGVIGTASDGPAFVPITVGNISDFYAKFGKTDGKKFGPMAVSEWMRNANSVTYLRVLGIGDGKKRNVDGTVTNAGFIVGEQLPDDTGNITRNPYANPTPAYLAANKGGSVGRVYFISCFMSESIDTNWLSSANALIKPPTQPITPVIRGLIMAASGVIITLSASTISNNAWNYSAGANAYGTSMGSGGGLTQVRGSEFGSINLTTQNFTLMLNGMRADYTSTSPREITASLNMTSPDYFANVLNKDPYKLQEKGHYLYAHWDVYPTIGVLTGVGVVSTVYGAYSAQNVTRWVPGAEPSIIISTSSVGDIPNIGNQYTPNYENWQDRFRSAKTPWIISQDFGGSEQNLFRLHALSAGAGVSEKYKFSIENLAPSSDPLNKYGTFDLIVRDWNDYDSSVRALEQFRGLSLDPSSDRYIAKVIGDLNVYYDFEQPESNQKLVIEGNYPNRSNIIRVEMAPAIEAGLVDPTALPFGFRGPAHLVTSGSAPLSSRSSLAAYSSVAFYKCVQQPPIPMRINLAQGSTEKKSVNPNLYWGVQFEHITDWADPNNSTLKNKSINSYVKYYPDFTTSTMPVIVGDNVGSPDTAQNGIVDSDRFHNNKFSLNKIQVFLDSNGIADSTRWSEASYVRNGVSSPQVGARAFNINDLIPKNRRFVKFTFFMQGGFDGTNIFDKDLFELTNVALDEEMSWDSRGRSNGPTIKSYLKALDIIKNTSLVDIQLLAIPGIRHSQITNAAINVAESRYDSLYVMDVEQVDNKNLSVISDSQMPSVILTTNKFVSRQLDSSFAAAYFPDVVLADPNVQTNVTVPPSVVVLGALALNDKLGHPWFAPAGFARAGLQTTKDVRVKLSKTNLDKLYDASINPIVIFPNDPKNEAVVWGQKTLQLAASSLDRVNVRRLLIDLRRQVRDIARTIIFEPNRDSTLAKFSAAVTPYLQSVQSKFGLDRFKVVIDSSTTTQLDIENNTIRGKIFVQPTKSIEFVSLDFVVSNNIG